MAAALHRIDRIVFDLALATAAPAPARAMQERISAFCRASLPLVLEEGLHGIDHAGQDLALERIELDVGRISADAGDDELGRQVAAALGACLDQLKLSGQLAPPEPALRALGEFLTQGRAAAPVDADALAMAAWRAGPAALAAALRRWGARHDCRMRLARALSVPVCAHLVRLLAGPPAEAINDYVDDLSRLHRRRPLVAASASAFDGVLWELVFTYLLVERGSHFNTTSFIASHVERLAARYRTSYAVLLAELSRCVAAPGAGTPACHGLAFMLAELARAAPRRRSATAAPDGMAHAARLLNGLDTFLRGGAWPGVAQAGEGASAALAQLLQTDPDGLCRLLRRRCGGGPALRRLLGALNQDETEALVRVLEPADGERIVAHAAAMRAMHARQPLVAQGTAPFARSIWELTMGYLLADRGSRFNTRTFVKDMVRKLAARHGQRYDTLLFGMLACVRPPMPPRRHGLPDILLSLADEAWLGIAPAAAGASPGATAACDALAHWMIHGAPPPAAAPGWSADAAVAAAAAHAPRALAEVLKLGGRPAARRLAAGLGEAARHGVLGVLAGPGSGAIADAIALFKLARARRPLPGLDAGAFARFVWTAIFDFLLATPAPAGLATLARHLASELARRHGMPPAEAARWFQAEPGTPVRTGTLDAIAPAHAAGAIGAGPAPAPSEPLRAGQGQAAALACLLLHGAAPPAVTPGALAMWLATIDDATWREVLRRYGSREPLLRRVASGLGAAVRDTAVRLAAGPELQSVQELIAALSAAGRHLTLDSAAEFSAALHYCLLASLLAGGASPSHPRLSLRGLILSVVRALAVRYRKPSRVLLAAAIDACGSDRLRPALRLAYHTHARAGAPAAAPTGPRATLELALHYLEFGVVPEAATGASTAAVLQQLNSGALLNAGARLAAPLRAMPCKEVVAQRLLRNLPARHRRRLLQLLAPTSAGLLESLLLASASGARLLDGIAPHTLLSCHWEQMLCMLLHAEAGAWQGRRLLEEMAQRVARQLGLPRDVYLAAMRGAAGQQARAQQRFEPLLDLLSQLPPAAGERPGPRTGRGARVAVETAAPPACAALAAFLRYGSTPAGWRGTPAQLVDAALEQEPEALRRIVLEAAGHVLERARLAQLLSDAQLQKILPGLLGQQYPAVSLCLGALCASRATGDDGAPYREALLQQLQPGDGARFSLAAFAGAAARRARSEHGVAEEQLLARARQSLHGSTGAGHEHVRAALAQAARACEQRELAEEYGWTALAPFDAPDGRDGTADRSPRPPSPVLPADQPFRVPNAGLVLLWQYMHPYFSALGLLAGRAFAGPPQQQRAACLLQLLACGSMRAPEHDLLLNKLLCGVEAGTPLACDTALTEQERTLADQLLYSITQHWRPLNNTSLDVLRATFLMREGSLVRQEEHWTLAVAAGPYDMLLQSLPWQVSTIRLPWMSAALQVQWKGRGT